MSRPDKRYRRPEEERGMRLFAFNNFIGGYRPMHGIDGCAIILRTQIKRPTEHPALQWKPLAEHVLNLEPRMHATFVLDASPLDPSVEATENTSHGIEGPLLRRASNIVSKLAPAAAVLVGAGATAPLAAKMALCCKCASFIGHVVLVCPSFPAVLECMRPFGARTAPPASQRMKLTLVVDAASALTLETCSGALGSLFDVNVVRLPAPTALFRTVAEVVVPTASSDGPQEGTRGPLECFRVDFVLSRYTKQPEQEVSLSPVHMNPNMEEDVVEAAVEEEPPQPAPTSGHSRGHFMQSDFVNVKGATVMFEGTATGDGHVATVLGITEVSRAPKEIAEIPRGTPLKFTAQLYRDDDGCTRISGLHIANVTIGGSPTFFSCGDQIPRFNFSQIRHFFGAALIRGRRVVLTRSLEGVWRGLRFPHRPHCDAEQTPLECAIAAIADQCDDVSPDNYFAHPAIAPVAYYPPDAPNTCVTLFVMFAVAAPSDYQDGAPDCEQLRDGYDWYSYDRAAAKLTTRAERDALADIRRNVRRAHAAGMYEPLDGCGVFGDTTESALPPATAESRVPTEVSDSGCGQIQATALLVAHTVVPVAAAAVESWAGPFHVWSEGPAPWYADRRPLCVVVAADVDLQVFAEQLLPPLLPQDDGPAVRVAIVAGGSALEDVLLRADAATVRRCLAALSYADAFVAVDGTPPLLQHLLREARPDLPLMDVDAAREWAQSGAVPPALPLHPVPELLVVRLTDRLPFHPERLHAEVCRTGLEAAWGCRIVHVFGSAWLATCTLHKTAVECVRGPEGTSLTLLRDAPWWCCVEEGDRPEGLDTSAWTPQHGSRTQSLAVVVLADPSTHAAVTTAITASLRAALCDPADFRHWHRLNDPFKLNQLS